MKRNDRYKSLVKSIFSMLIIMLEVLIYWNFWIGYFNKIIEFPFWRKGNWLMTAVYAGFMIFFFSTYGGFKIGQLKKGNLICSQILSIIFVNIITYFLIALIDKRFHNPQMLFAMSILESIVAILWIFLFQWVYGRMFPPKRMLLIYGERPAFHLMDNINSREDKYYLADSMNINCGEKQIIKWAKDFDAVIIGDVPSQERNRLMKLCFRESIRTYTIPKISDILIRTSTELNIFDSPLLLSRNEGMQADQRFIKRLIDILFAGIGLLITTPFFVIIALAIKLTDKGPIFYKQKRLTQNNKIFEIYKFRTMIQDAEKHSGATLASECDERILPIGRFLRRTRLDELPQLWNILKGEMSVVGPRPERPELSKEIEAYIPEFSYRLMVKAGLTGYAQIYGKYNTTAYDKLKLDLTYIRKYSLLLDLRLMLMTPKIMLLKESTEGVSTAEYALTSVCASDLKDFSKEIMGRNSK